MKITIINGGPRINGSTATILKLISKNIEQFNNVDLTYFNLSEYEIKTCIGCRTCYQDDYCIIKNDEINDIIETVKQSDGIIIGSPTFGGYYTGLLKSFFDRGNFILSQSLKNKHILNVITYEIAAGNEAMKALNNFSKISGATLSRGIIKKLNFNDNVHKDENLKIEIYKKTNNFYNKIRFNKQRTLPDVLLTYILVNIIWKPIFISRKPEFTSIINNWIEKGIIKAKKGI